MQFVMDPQHQQHHQAPPQATAAAAAQSPPPPPPPPRPQPLPAAFQLHMSAPYPPPPQAAPGAAAQPIVPQIQNQNNSGQVTSPPTPNLVSVPVTNHPPYAQMITEAITALKDKEGSSKRAIAKYIESAYSNANLPDTHSALLTYHLKRLKEQGHIVMVKHSYMLPNSFRSPPAAPSPFPIPASNGVKRGPGRPRKIPAQPTASSAAPFAPAPPPTVTVPGPNVDPASVFVSLGLADWPLQVQAPVVPVPVSSPGTAAKRRPGRPKKTPGPGGSTTPGLQPNPTMGKKSAGRPRKVAAKNAVNAVVNAAAATTGFGSVVVNPRVQPKLKADGTPAKPRGRPPKKNLRATPAAAAATVGAPTAADAVLVPAVYIGEGPLATTPIAASRKRRGRPPLKAQNGLKSPRKLSGKPLGRPRKIVPPTVAQGPSMQQLLAYNEMRSKLDFFQTKLKQSLTALKPHLDGASDAAAAQGALRELEELANLELGLPANVQAQQPAQPQN